MQFEEQVKLLTSAGAQCTVYDMLGCGRSSKPRPASPEGRTAAYSAHEHYADLEAVLDTLVAGKVGILLLVFVICTHGRWAQVVVRPACGL